MPSLPEADSRVWSGATEAEAGMVVQHLKAHGVAAHVHTPLGTAGGLAGADVYVQPSDAEEALRLVGELQSEDPELGFEAADAEADEEAGAPRGVFTSRAWLPALALIAIAGLVFLLLSDVI